MMIMYKEGPRSKMISAVVSTVKSLPGPLLNIDPYMWGYVIIRTSVLYCVFLGFGSVFSL